ncbi:MAG: hypothetical protein M1415_01110, partial [Firmicutes bacterium]|nr:hypothetical protein [Bacillota bacterium]
VICFSSYLPQMFQPENGGPGRFRGNPGGVPALARRKHPPMALSNRKMTSCNSFPYPFRPKL